MPAVLEVEKLVYGGEGLGRIDGQVVLMPYVLGGERVSIEAAPSSGGLLRAPEPEVLGPSPERVVAQCPYFRRCGGCHYQHASYPAQLEIKRAILRETLARTGGLEYAGDLETLSGEPWDYRNRVQLHFHEGEVGYYERESNHICPIEKCPISSPKINDAIAVLVWAAKQREWPAFLRSLEIFTNESDVQLNITDTMRPVAARFFEWLQPHLPGFAPGAIEYRVGARTFRVGRGSFFQVNRFLAEQLVSAVVPPDYPGGHDAWDLYAGVGLFTEVLAQKFEVVHAVERGASAHRDLLANFESQKNVYPAQGASLNFLRSMDGRPRLIVADPPRAGLGKEVVAELLRLSTAELVVVSCDPATLARDLKALTTQYELTRLVLIDLFPQTFHIEAVAHLHVR